MDYQKVYKHKFLILWICVINDHVFKATTYVR